MLIDMKVRFRETILVYFWEKLMMIQVKNSKNKVWVGEEGKVEDHILVFY
ncbi:hypothetical protein Hanom_Chr15g01361341 [Helianthus anomalus]